MNFLFGMERPPTEQKMYDNFRQSTKNFVIERIITV